MAQEPLEEIIDQLEDERVGSKEPEPAVKHFKCGSCGAKLEFKPGSDVQKCPYCSHENPIPKSEDDICELDFKEYLTKLQEDEQGPGQLQESLTVQCRECAAEISTDANITSQECPYCGCNFVATAVSKKQIKPRSLLSFKVTSKQAWESFRGWIKKLWFAPNDLKKFAQQNEKLKGMYVPYWTYDADTTSFYHGMRGDYYWVTQTYTTTQNGKSVTRTRQVRKIRWWPASGTVWKSFDDVLVLASESLPRKYTEKLEPWDLQNLLPYKDEYLSGFRAESYQIDLARGFDYARAIMDQEIRRLIKLDIGGDQQQITSVKTQHDKVTFKHILLPVWISAYRYRQRVFRFLVNARTGEVQGERPWSWVKIVLAVLAGAALVGLAVWIYFMSQQ